jgi:hypothetical protein
MTTVPRTPREQYTAPGGAHAYAVHFAFYEDADLVVLVTVAGVTTTKVLDSDYTVSGGSGAGGTVTASFDAGATVTIYRNLPVEQTFDPENGDDLDADGLEEALDRGVYLLEQLADDIGRTMQLPPETPADVSAALPTPVADYFLRFAPDGKSIVASPVADLGAVGLATETTAGIGELATDPEMIAGTPGKLADAEKVKTYAALAGVTALPRGYFSGFTLSNNAGDASHDIDVAAGAARDDANAMNLVTSATIVKQTDVAFAEYSLPGTASGGMDSATALTGSPAPVHVFMIGGAGKNTQPFCSTNIAPNLPTGFTNKDYVNSLWWDGSALLPFKQRGRDEIQLTTPPNALSTTNPATTARTITLASFPTGVELLAKVSLLVLTTTAAATTGLSALDVTNQDPATAFGFDVMVTSSTGEFDASVGWVKTNTSGQVRARCSAGGAANSEKITTLGWRVMRG